MNKRQNARHKLNQYEKLHHKNNITQHHILNRCRRDLFNVFEKGNTTPMPEGEHQLWHLKHRNETPQETLRNTYWMTQVMSDHAKQLYNELCNMSLEEFYAPKYVRKKR